MFAAYQDQLKYMRDLILAHARKPVSREQVSKTRLVSRPQASIPCRGGVGRGSWLKKRLKYVAILPHTSLGTRSGAARICKSNVIVDVVDRLRRSLSGVLRVSSHSPMTWLKYCDRAHEACCCQEVRLSRLEKKKGRLRHVASPPFRFIARPPLSVARLTPSVTDAGDELPRGSTAYWCLLCPVSLCLSESVAFFVACHTLSGLPLTTWGTQY